jgi:hypothetical protein
MNHVLRNVSSFEVKLLAVEPAVVVLFIPEEDIQVVITQYALGQAVVNQALDEFQDGGAIGATVGQIAEEDETTAFGVGAVVTKAEVGKKVVDGLDLAVSVSDGIDTARE